MTDFIFALLNSLRSPPAQFCALVFQEYYVGIKLSFFLQRQYLFFDVTTFRTQYCFSDVASQNLYCIYGKLALQESYSIREQGNFIVALLKPYLGVFCYMSLAMIISNRRCELCHFFFILCSFYVGYVVQKSNVNRKVRPKRVATTQTSLQILELW